MKNLMSVLAFAAAALLVAISPGSSAEATTCDDSGPSDLFLELESVTVDGTPVDPVEETWARLHIWDYWQTKTADKLEFKIWELWTDRWGLGGRVYVRTEK